MRKVQLRPTVAVAAALAPSSIKTSQIDAVVKREEESPTPARFYAITPAPPSFSFVRETNLLLHPLPRTFVNRSRTTTLHRTPSLPQIQARARTGACITQSNLRGVTFCNHVNPS